MPDCSTLSRIPRPLALAAAGTAAVGLGTLAYAGTIGLTRFTIRHEQPAVLPPRARPLRILHISDIHYVPGQRRKFAWLQSLAELQPDLVVNTGDNLSHREAVPELLEALGPLRRFPGVFVTGSNDYHGPRLKNPLGYLFGPSAPPAEPEHLPTDQLVAGFTGSGWIDLRNRARETVVAGRSVHLSGVDDPHIDLDRFAGWPQDAALHDAQHDALRLGIAHAPMGSTLTTFADTGADLILAGHTHGGQVCLPGRRALVTNCDLPRSQASGLSTTRSSTGREVPLHVSAGVGTSRTAPLRFNCPPEATVLDLVPRG
ncbi:metallophosphoesterase [Nesterenkonia sp. F]|uniref:metallophosphoesterase n=1 Tax=Nesterenkonia sp. F TaxID=795955 RepID=UPI000255C921|nr:metallophosphoesterase [Nesterenkonia sp. F]